MSDKKINYGELVHKGRRKEYKIMKELKTEGFNIVTRSAGSHSAIDVIGIKKNPKTIKLIQSKPKHFSKKEKQRLIEDLNWLNDSFLVEFKVIQ